MPYVGGVLFLKGVTSEVIANVRNRAAIEEVIGEFLVLKRAGKEFKALCPFHKEKSPSFHVNAEKGIFKCFGCGEGGDVFAFWQKMKGLDFIESVRDLAHKYGVELVETTSERNEYDKRGAMLMLYEQACQYYIRLLADETVGAPIRNYLDQRGIDKTIIDKFKLGYAPDSFDGLLRYLTNAAKVTADTLAEAGLVRRKAESGSYYDLFRHRLIIPICDNDGRVIAFGGRTMGDSEIKYLNSPETPIYKKGQHLYAFHLAKQSIKEADAVIVVEGYFDAITSHLHGFTNTVATLGTALTEDQAKALVRYTDSKRVYLAFDADLAGVKAVDRGVATLNQIAEGIGIDIRVIQVPGGKDPDECLRANDKAAVGNGEALYRQAIATALPLIDYQLHKAIEGIDTSSHIGKIDASKKVVPVLATIKNSVARGEYIRRLCNKLALREEELFLDVRQYLQSYRHKAAYRAENASTVPSRQANMSKAQSGGALRDGYIEAEKQLLALYFRSRDDYDQVYEALIDETLISPAHQSIKEAIEGIGGQFNNAEDLRQKVMDRVTADKNALSAFVEVIIKVDEISKQNAPVSLLLKHTQKRLLQERLDRLLSVMRSRQVESADDDEAQKWQSRIKELEHEKVKLATVVTAASEGGTARTDDMLGVKRKIEALIAFNDAEPVRVETRL